MVQQLAQNPSFNTQPPEGGWFSGFRQIRRGRDVSTHSRPKAAGTVCLNAMLPTVFQHTAARRRLAWCK